MKLTKYIVSNIQNTKGVIIKASEAFIAAKEAHKAFYGAFSAIHAKDLTTVQALEQGRNFPFSTSEELLKFERVQFSFTGSGSGVTTSYNTHIYIEPTQQQKDFIGESKIEFVKFWNGNDLTEARK